MADDAKLRVLLVAHGLPPMQVGGVEQHVDALARALTAAGHSVHVFAKRAFPGRPQGSLVDAPLERAPYQVTEVAYRYENLTSFDDLYRAPIIDRAFAAFLADHRFEIAHVHHLTGLSTGIFEILRANAIPSLLTLHDYWLICPRGQMWHRDGTVTDAVDPERCADCLRPGFGGFVPRGAGGPTAVADMHRRALETLARPDRLIVPSASAAAPFVALGVPAERIEVVENGVDVAALRQLPLPAPSDDTPLRVGILGSLIPTKGLHVLVESVQRLRGEVALHVHGNATPYHGDASYLTTVFAGLRPVDRFRYHGPYGPQALRSVLAGIDLVAAPALWRETFGLTPREALAAGRPVLASRIGGLADALTDGVEGFLLPPGDVGALTDALHTLAKDRSRFRRMARAARDRPVRSIAEMSEELLGIYRELR